MTIKVENREDLEVAKKFKRESLLIILPEIVETVLDSKI